MAVRLFKGMGISLICKGTTKSGEACLSKRVLASGYCWHHETPEARKGREEAAREQFMRVKEKALARSRRIANRLKRRYGDELKRLMEARANEK